MPSAKKLPRPNLRQISLFLALAASALVGRAQVNSAWLVQSFTGKDVHSTIQIGDKGSPAGMSSSYPVNTLAYSDGQIIYRVEWAYMRGVMARAEKSFAPGTAFTVSSVEIKNDRIEFKLVARDRDTGRLKLMLGRGWQTSLNDASVLEAISRFLESDVRSPATTPASTNSSSTITPAIKPSKSAGETYTRNTSINIPNRPAVEAVDTTLAELGAVLDTARSQIAADSSFFARGLKACAKVYGPLRDAGSQRLAGRISVLQDSIGTNLVPATESDAKDLALAYQDCRLVAQQRQAGDVSGRQFGPGANNSDYASAFLGDSGISTARSDYNQMLGALRLAGQAESDLKAVVTIERALDEGNDGIALSFYNDLQARADSPPIRAYLEKSALLQSDLRSLASARRIDTDPQQDSLVGELKHGKQLEDLRSATSNYPMTQRYLESSLKQQQAAFRNSVRSAPAFVPCVRPSSPAKADKLVALRARAQVIEACLGTNANLEALAADPSAYRLAQMWLGADSGSLEIKMTGIAEARTQLAAVENQIASLVASAQKQEEVRVEAARQQDLTAHEVVDAALRIMQLDQRFSRYQIYGELIESQKYREQLNSLLKQHRSAETRRRIQDIMDRVEQTMTVSDVMWLESLLGQVRP